MIHKYENIYIYGTHTYVRFGLISHFLHCSAHSFIKKTMLIGTLDVTTLDDKKCIR